MFFPRVTLLPHGLIEPYAEIYLLALQESMDHINATCRYQHPEEFMDVLPEKEFMIVPNETRVSSSVWIREGISMTDALNSMFHDILSDVGDGPKVIDCMVANCLVAAQAARFVLGDDNLNAFVDEKRGGRDKPILIRSSNTQKLSTFFFEAFGVFVKADQSPPSYQPGEARFGYMLQRDPDAYSKKHDYLTSRGFHHIVLPNGSVLAFAPDVGGKFKSIEDLAKYMLLEMNKDLSSQEWCIYIKNISDQLFKQLELQPHTVLVDDILNLATNNLSLFLDTLEIMSTIDSEEPETGENEFITQCVLAYFTLMNIDISADDISYILCLCLSLHTHFLPKNLIKISECLDNYNSMKEQASTMTSVFNIRHFQSSDVLSTSETPHFLRHKAHQ